MKYRDMFIYKDSENKFHTTSYYICEYVCDRPEKKCYLAYTLGFFHNYMEIPYKHTDKIFDLAGFKKEILKENDKIKRNLEKYREVYNIMKRKSVDGFNMFKFLNIYFDLREREEYLIKKLDELETRPDRHKPYIEKEVELKTQELHEVRRGIRRKYKRLHKLFLIYTEEELKGLKNPDTKIRSGERSIKENNDRLIKIEKEWNEEIEKRKDLP